MPTATDLDRFERLLGGDPAASAAATAGERQLASLATVLGSAHAPAADPDFKLALRTQLVAAAREQAAPGMLARMRGAFDQATARWRYSARVAGATGAVALALSSGGVAAAAEHALPGDALYSVKLSLEDVRLAFTPGETARARRQLSYAADRLTEARAAAGKGDMDGAVLALREADETARDAAQVLIAQPDPSGILALEAFTTRQRDLLEDLLPMLTGAAADAASDVLDGLAHIESLLPDRPSPLPSGDPTIVVPSTGAPQVPTSSPAPTPTVPVVPTSAPTATPIPTTVPTTTPTEVPTDVPTAVPTDIPTELPTALPTLPVDAPTVDTGEVVDDVIDTTTGAVAGVTDATGDTADAAVDAVTDVVDILLGGL